MTHRLTYFGFLVITLLQYSAASLHSTSQTVNECLQVRVRRQDGYVYDKPNVSFDLPSRPTAASTQAPTVDRTLAQQMFYAYPAPAARGDAVLVGGAAPTTAAPPATSGYNYRPAAGTGGVSTGTGVSDAGYNYGTAATVGAQAGVQVTSSGTGGQANAGTQLANAGSQTVSGSGVSGTSQSGYGYNVPTPTLSPTLQTVRGSSTSAPEYLPPTGLVGGGGGTGGTTRGNIGGNSVSIGVGQGGGSSSSGQGSSVSVGTPSESYLPPLGTSNSVTSGQSVVSTSSTTTQVNSGGSGSSAVSVPSTAYLPPNQSSSSPQSPPSGGPQSAPVLPPSAGYIPPPTSGSNSGSVSTPATAYLPPLFF